jgi:hypothetical protein
VSDFAEDLKSVISTEASHRFTVSGAVEICFSTETLGSAGKTAESSTLRRGSL